VSEPHPPWIAIEDIECFTEEQLARSSADIANVAWARVVWLPKPYRSLAHFLGRWVARNCEGAGTPWEHNRLYRAKVDDVYLEFKVADLRNCSGCLKPPMV
jgi:hypothetical protein